MSVFLQPLEYLSVWEYCVSTESELRDKSHDTIHSYICRAEARIRERIELESEVPYEIKQATVLVTDRIYSDSLKQFSKKEVIEEKDENHTRKYQIMEDKDIFSWEVADLIRPFLKIGKTKARFYRT